MLVLVGAAVAWGAVAIGAQTYTPPKTPWGKPAMGYRTRRAKTTGRLIVRSRRRK